MNMMKNIMLMSAGGAMALVYQKYNKKVMKAMKNAFSDAASKANDLTDKLDNMMQKKDCFGGLLF